MAKSETSYGFYLRTGWIVDSTYSDHLEVKFFGKKSGKAGRDVHIPREKFHARYSCLDTSPEDERFVDRLNPEIWELSWDEGYVMRPCSGRSRQWISITEEVLEKFFWKIPYQVPVPKE